MFRAGHADPLEITSSMSQLYTMGCRDLFMIPDTEANTACQVNDLASLTGEELRTRKAALQQCGGMEKTAFCSPATMSQSLAVPSQLAVTMSVPDGENTIWSTLSSCPRHNFAIRSVFLFHKRILPSS